MNKKNNTNKKLPKPKIKEIAGQFDIEFQNHVVLVPLKNGAIGYKDFIIKRNNADSWCIYNIKNLRESIGEFKLKTCALMAARAYSLTRINKYLEIQDIDNQYWANYSNGIVYRNIIKKQIDLDRFIIVLNKLEDSEAKVDYLKRKITSMFRTSFV